MAVNTSNVKVALIGLIGIVIFMFFFSALFPGAVTTLIGINTDAWTDQMVLLLDFIIIIIFLAIALLVLQMIGLKLF